MSDKIEKDLIAEKEKLQAENAKLAKLQAEKIKLEIEKLQAENAELKKSIDAETAEKAKLGEKLDKIIELNTPEKKDDDLGEPEYW